MLLSSPPSIHGGGWKKKTRDNQRQDGRVQKVSLLFVKNKKLPWVPEKGRRKKERKDSVLSFFFFFSRCTSRFGERSKAAGLVNKRRRLYSTPPRPRHFRLERTSERRALSLGMLLLRCFISVPFPFVWWNCMPWSVDLDWFQCFWHRIRARESGR